MDIADNHTSNRLRGARTLENSRVCEKWGLPTLSQGAPFATRGQSGQSPFFAPPLEPRVFIPIVVRNAMGTPVRAASRLISTPGQMKTKAGHRHKCRRGTPWACATVSLFTLE